MFFFLLFGLLPDETIIREQCDRIEVNHFYNGDGKKIFAQLIFWEWSDRASAFRVRGFYVTKKENVERPRWDYARGCYFVRYRTMGRSYEIESPIFLETWTQYDRELEDREFFSTYLRAEIGKTPPEAAKRKNATTFR